MEQAKKYQALYYPTPGRPWIRARYLYLMGDYEFKVFDKKGKIVGVYECMHDAEKKCEELENGNTVEQSL